MTILNINKYHFIKGGAERFYFELAKLLEEHGHEVVPFAMRYPLCHPVEKRDPEKNINYSQYFVSEVQTEKISFSWQGLRTAARYFWSFEARRKLEKIINDVETCHGVSLQRHGIDLAILHNIYHQISPSILPMLKKHGIPTILIAHDYALLSPNYNMFVRGKVYDKICGCDFLKCIPDRCVRNSFLASLICGLETWFHHSVLNIYKKSIDRVICPSQFMYKMFLKAGWPQEKLIHLPYFIYPSHPSPSKGEDFKLPLLTKEGVGGGYLLYFGRLSPEKAVDILIEAMKNLPEVKLKIVGKGLEKENYELRIMNYGLQNVEMLGYKSGNELTEIIAGAKFIVAPSVWYENYPLSVLEAHSLGVPALVSNIGGLPEMIPEQDKNFLFEPSSVKELSEKIKFLWESERVVNEARDKVKNFVKENNNPEKYYEKLAPLFYP